MLAAGLAACGEDNRYVAPPPPKVTVAPPMQQQITPYLEATGNTTAINTVNLVARVAGFVQEIKYNDGDFAKKGTPLFVIEPEPYKLKLDQAKGSQDSAEAALKQSEAEFKRQADLISRQVSTQANYDKALAQRDSDRGSLEQAQSNTAQAVINYGYTTVMAPFDGIVTARQVSIGELVGSTSPTTLATIVQLDPIYVNFTISERDVLKVRAATMAARGHELTQEELRRIPVEVGLQSESGFPHKGTLDYAAPTVDQSTGTLAVRGILQNPTSRFAARLFRPRAHTRAAAFGAARAGDRNRQRSGRPLRAGCRQGRRCRAAQSGHRCTFGRLTRDRERARVRKTA